jgi:hypothetical protein
VQLASLGLALVVWTSGCAGSAGAADASSCPDGPGCADTAAPDGTHIGELPDAPSSHLVASPTPLEFGYVGLGQRPQLTLTVANTGSAPVNITGFRLAGHLSFTLDGLHPDDPVGWSAASAAGGGELRRADSPGARRELQSTEDDLFARSRSWRPTGS